MDTERNRLLDSPFVARAARWGIVAWAAIGVVALMALVFRFVLYPVRIIFPPLLLALIFVYLLNPVVSWLKQRGVPRVLGVLIAYVVLLAALAVGLRFLVPVIVDQVQGLTRSLPSLLDRAQQTIQDILARAGVEGQAATLTPESQQVIDVAERLLSLTLGVLSGVLILILGLILGFYLLVDLPKLSSGVITLIPGRRRAEVTSLLEKLGGAIGGFFRGQLLVAIFVGLASMLALYIVGLPYWALVGLISGLFNLIPLIGPFIGGLIAVFVAFTTPTSEGLLQLDPGWPLAIGAALALLIVQQIDNHIISPNVVARTVKLHPVTVMLAILAGGALLGLWGMLLAVPVVASAKIVLLHYWDTRVSWPPPGGEATEERAPPAEGEAAEEPAPGAPRSHGGPVRRWLRGRGRRKQDVGRPERVEAEPGEAERAAPREPAKPARS